MIKTEPVGRPALKVLFYILAVISIKEKFIPTQKTQEGSVHLIKTNLCFIIAQRNTSLEFFK